MYKEFLETLSRCGIGVLLTDSQNIITEGNKAALSLLRLEESPAGSPLEETAPFLCENASDSYANPDFDEYLISLGSVEIPGLSQNITARAFKSVPGKYKCALLEEALNQVHEPITVFDDEFRLYFLNTAAEKIESHTAEDVIGMSGYVLYQTPDDEELTVPMVLRDKQPVLNRNMVYSTHLGKELHVITNDYPVLRNGQLLGAVCIQEDLSSLEAVFKKYEGYNSALKGSKGTRRGNNGSSARYHFSDIMYVNPVMRSLISKCRMISGSDSAVMIYGETGTGKEMFAQSIHNESRRKDAPFIDINCAAIPENLLEGLLFGTEKGAYTGSVERAGLLEMADGGTLLLDEINSMDIQLQSKLLRFLQEGTLRRVGGIKTISVDVRIISNINMPPMQAIDEGLLRADLYYRLGVINLTVPPLRERTTDIPLLVKTFIDSCNHKVRKNIRQADDKVLQIFYAYSWPGNVRELHHAIEYALNILPYDAETITAEYLPDHILQSVDPGLLKVNFASDQNKIKAASNDAVRRVIIDELSQCNGNVTKAAQALGVTRQNLQHYIKSLSIEAK